MSETRYSPSVKIKGDDDNQNHFLCKVLRLPFYFLSCMEMCFKMIGCVCDMIFLISFLMLTKRLGAYFLL